MNNALRLSLTAIAIAALAACQSLPTNSALLEQARSGYRAAQEDPNVRHFAGVELLQAKDAMEQADAAWARNEELAEVDHMAYLAKQRVAIAEGTTARKRAELAVTEAGASRDQIRLAARTSEADASQRSAALAERSAVLAQRNADASQRQATEAQARNGQLEAQVNEQLKALNAKNTDRGMVITIGDVLFDTNRSQLKPGGLRSLDKLVAFLTQ